MEVRIATCQNQPTNNLDGGRAGNYQDRYNRNLEDITHMAPRRLYFGAIAMGVPLPLCPCSRLDVLGELERC
jgi:hypothetical protein